MTAQAATAIQESKTPATIRTIPTDNLFDRFQEIYDLIGRRAYELFDSNGKWFGHELDDWLRAESEILHPVHLEISETDENLTVRAEVPGFTSRELDISVEPRRVIIAGKHESKEESKKGKTVYSERCAREILRSVDLPAEVDGSKVTASVKDGVLTLDMPKAAHAKTVHVEAKAAI